MKIKKKTKKKTNVNTKFCSNQTSNVEDVFACNKIIIMYNEITYNILNLDIVFFVN